jgi:hypothetical protein
VFALVGWKESQSLDEDGHENVLGHDQRQNGGHVPQRDEPNSQQNGNHHREQLPESKVQPTQIIVVSNGNGNAGRLFWGCCVRHHLNPQQAKSAKPQAASQLAA